MILYPYVYVIIMICYIDNMYDCYIGSFGEELSHMSLK